MPFVNHIKSGWVRTWINSFLNESPDISRFFAKVGKRIWKTHQLGMQKPNWTLLHVYCMPRGIRNHVPRISLKSASDLLTLVYGCLHEQPARRDELFIYIFFFFLFTYGMEKMQSSTVHLLGVQKEESSFHTPMQGSKPIPIGRHLSAGRVNHSVGQKSYDVMWCDLIWCIIKPIFKGKLAVFKNIIIIIITVSPQIAVDRSNQCSSL